MPDAEIEAMGKVAGALGELEEDERGRVLRWVAERYGVVLAKSRGKVDEGDDDDGGDEEDAHENNGGGSRGYEHFAELYDATDPSTDAEKVLVASYWAQVINGKTSFGSRELNKELKDLGHAVSAINKAMSSNMKKKPSLILQVSRGGGSPQAQKRYKVSDAGKKWVEAKLS